MGKLVSVILFFKVGKLVGEVGKLVSVIFVLQGGQIGGGSGQIGYRYFRCSR